MVIVDERGRLSIGYVVFGFPQVSETFISDEIGELHRQGVAVTVFTLEARPLGTSPAAEDGPAARVKDLSSPAKISWKINGAFRLLLWGARNPGGVAAVLRIAATAGRPVGRSLFQAVFLADELKDHPVHLLHAGFANQPATVAMFAAVLARVPFTFAAHAVDIFVDPELMEAKLARAAYVRVVSEYNRRYLAEHFGANGKLCVIPCGVVPEVFSRTRHSAERTFELVSVCRLVPKKGLVYAIEAVRALRNRGVPVHYTVAGDGPLNAELRARVSALGLDDTVDFVGPISPARVRCLLANAAAFILPCVRAADGNTDGLPVAILEAMAAGTPVVSTQIAGVPEAVKHDAGLLVPPGDQRALVRALLEVYDDWRNGRDKFRGGPDIVRDRFSLRTNVALWRRVLEGAVSV
jgi:colanic acid/amylovoran biosynthesis glycosyltransferase